MKAVIVAAGQGTRLRGIGELKPLVPVRGRPLIEHVICSALQGGVREFIVVTGYRAEQLEAFLAELAAARGLPVRCVRNPDFLGQNGLSVAAAAPLVNEAFLLLMADHLFDPSIVRDLIAKPLIGTRLVLAIDRRLHNPLVDLSDVTRVLVAADERICAIGKGIPEFNAFDTGIFLTSPALIQAVREDMVQGGSGSITAGVLRLAGCGLATTLDIGQRFWLDVDDAAAHAHAEREYSPVSELRPPNNTFVVGAR